MILPRDRYPKTKRHKKLTTSQRKAMAQAFLDRLMAEVQTPKHPKQERP